MQTRTVRCSKYTYHDSNNQGQFPNQVMGCFQKKIIRHANKKATDTGAGTPMPAASEIKTAIVSGTAVNKFFTCFHRLDRRIRLYNIGLLKGSSFFFFILRQAAPLGGFFADGVAEIPQLFS